jgi:hypothetical protein
MTLEISIVVHNDHICISESKHNIQFTVANLLTIKTSSQTVVEIGKTEKEIADHFPGDWTKEKAHISFQKIYEPENFKPKNFWLFLGHFVIETRNAIYTHFIQQIFPFNTSYSLSLMLPDYEQLDTNTRDAFELKLPEVVSVQALTINGTEVETYNSQRRLAGWTYQLFLVMGMVSFILFMAYFYSNKPLTSPFEILLFMVISGIVSMIGAFVGTIAWVVMFRKLMPTRLFTHIVFTRKMLPSAMRKFFDVKGG